MLICPIQNKARKLLNWIQKRPYITQKFGKNPKIYKQFRMKGHNGIDFRAAVGTPIFAPFSGEIKVIKSSIGYGLHIRIRSKEKKLECVLAHFSEIFVIDGIINMGDKIGLSGNTGFSTGPHLHLGVRNINPSSSSVWNWEIENYDNGYYGYWDCINYILTWKGTLTLNSF